MEIKSSQANFEICRYRPENGNQHGRVSIVDKYMETPRKPRSTNQTTYKAI